jgi:hypothetical protein
MTRVFPPGGLRAVAAEDFDHVTLDILGLRLVDSFDAIPPFLRCGRRARIMRAEYLIN